MTANIPPQDTEYQKLNPQQRRYVDAYLETWSQTVAAEQAGYKWPAKAGWRLMKLGYIQAAIAVRIRESAMAADEVLSRLAQQARVNISFFLEEKEVIDHRTGLPYTKIDVNWARVREYGYLIKELSWTRAGNPILKLVDNQKALELIGRHLGLFSDTLNLKGAVELTWADFVKQAMEKQDDPGTNGAE